MAKAAAKTARDTTKPILVGICSGTTFRITRLTDGAVLIERKPRVQQSSGRGGQVNTMHLLWEPLTEKEELHRWLIATVEANPATW